MKNKVLIVLEKKEEEGKKKGKNLMTFTTQEMKFEQESDDIDLDAFKIYIIAHIEEIVIYQFSIL